MKLFFLCFIFWVILLPVFSCRFSGNQNYSLVNGEYHYVLNSEDRRLKYHVLTFPEVPLREHSLLVLLHGFGDSGEHYLERWMDELSRHPRVVVAPDFDRNFSNNKADLGVLYGLIQEIQKKFNLSQSDVSIAGVSAGGVLAQWLIMERPDLFNQGVFISCPFMLDENRDFVRQNKRLKVLYVYGAKDESIEPDKIMSQAESLKQQGLDISLMEDPNAAHEMPEDWPKFILEWTKS